MTGTQLVLVIAIVVLAGLLTWAIDACDHNRLRKQANAAILNSTPPFPYHTPLTDLHLACHYQESTMNKPEAIARLDALEAEARKLREIIDAPDVDGLPLRNGGHFIETLNGGFTAYTPGCDSSHWANSLPSRVCAESYATALNTFMKLRHQPGTVAARHDVLQWIIEVDYPSLNRPELRIASYISLSNKTTRLSPCFNTKEAALNAAIAITRERIIDMFKTFHHVKG